MIKGYLLAALAAAFYGTNPIFAVPLYGLGMNVASVLLFRYILGIPLLALIIIQRSEGLALAKSQLLACAAAGILMAFSSLALYESYACMNPGLASILLFMYPLFTTMIMILFFHEKFRLNIVLALIIIFGGLYLLMDPGEGASFNLKGFVWIFVSSLTYAIYLVLVKVSKTLRTIPNLQSLLYQLFFGSLLFVCAALWGQKISPPPDLAAYLNLGALALFPTVLSLLLTIKAIKLLGPTVTALFGALEPITAVLLSYLILGEALSLRESFGAMLIILATMLVMFGDAKKASSGDAS